LGDAKHQRHVMSLSKAQSQGEKLGEDDVTAQARCPATSPPLIAPRSPRSRSQTLSSVADLWDPYQSHWSTCLSLAPSLSLSSSRLPFTHARGTNGQTPTDLWPALGRLGSHLPRLSPFLPVRGVLTSPLSLRHFLAHLDLLVF
jgi:hypothetical protein